MNLRKYLYNGSKVYKYIEGPKKYRFSQLKKKVNEN